MGRKWMALALTLCLLLSGCGGGTSKPEAASSEQQIQTEAEISAVVLDDVETTEPAADSQPEPELDDMTPEELGQWAWNQLEAHSEASYAKDYDMEISVTVDIGGESTTQKANGRVKKIDSETDGYMYYEKMQVNGEVTENWYGNGYAYLSDSYGQYKAPMDEDAYDEMMNGFDRIDGIVKHAKEFLTPRAKVFAEEYKDEKLIYMMGSGANYNVAYSFAICLLMEMQWVNSSAIHSGEYFHGPFEITDRETPFIILMSEGRTRPLDQRALDFLNRFAEKVIILDAKELGLETIDDKVSEFFNPLLMGSALGCYSYELSIARKHPLSCRRYMWKLQY